MKTSGSKAVSTKLRQIAEVSGKAPGMVWTTLSHHIDLEWLYEAYRRTRKDASPGVDGITRKEYEANLDGNLRSLLENFKSGRYRAQPSRRTYIPKGDGKYRPLGIPTLEDKILQRAVLMVMEAIYEQDFCESSYGFRPGRTAHQALEEIRQTLMGWRGGWVLDVDIEGFFDNLDHTHLRNFLDKRIRDGVLRRTIDKWLKAGILEKGELKKLKSGTPQGGVISPLLSNLYLHEVLDKWFEDVVKVRTRGRVRLVRYADDFTVLCEHRIDAERIMKVLPKRLGKYGLQLHLEKTKMICFKPPEGGEGKNSFDFLGFTHYWGKSRRGRWAVKKKTSKGRLRRALKSVSEWCRRNMHLDLGKQREALSKKLEGHYSYYGVTGNSKSLNSFREEVVKRWRRWLMRRSQRGIMSWEKFCREVKANILPLPRIVHSVYRK